MKIAHEPVASIPLSITVRVVIFADCKYQVEYIDLSVNTFGCPRVSFTFHVDAKPAIVLFTCSLETSSASVFLTLVILLRHEIDVGAVSISFKRPPHPHIVISNCEIVSIVGTSRCWGRRNFDAAPHAGALLVTLSWRWQLAQKEAAPQTSGVTRAALNFGAVDLTSQLPSGTHARAPTQTSSPTYRHTGRLTSHPLTAFTNILAFDRRIRLRGRLTGLLQRSQAGLGPGM